MVQNELLAKLELFIRKYYKNLLIKGLISVSGMLVILFLIVATLEHYGRYNTTIRTILFYTFCLSAALLFYRFLWIPLTGLLKLGKRLSYEEAASLVGTYFSHVGDTLINTLQLQKQQADNALLLAAIEQKTRALHPFKFEEAIDLGKNKRYIHYGLIPVAILLLLAIVEPELIRDSPKRLVKHQVHFPAPAPFEFQILNDSLMVEQQKDYELLVEVSGKALPDEVWMQIDGNRYMMEKQSPDQYRYVFRNVRAHTNFILSGGGYESELFTLHVASIPTLQLWKLQLVYPAYTGKKSEWLTQLTDISVPVGTKAIWTIHAAHTGQVDFLHHNKTARAKWLAQGQFIYNHTLTKGGPYTMILHHPENSLSDTLNQYINLIPDAFPSLDVTSQNDSTEESRYYFAGQAEDDYGLSKLVFVSRIVQSPNPDRINKQLQSRIALPAGEIKHRFYHQFDLRDAGILPGESVESYFEVWDNDALAGGKFTRSKIQLYKSPDMSELLEQRDREAARLAREMQQAFEEAKKLQREIKELDQKLAEKKELTWEEKKKLEQMLEKQRKLQQQLEQIKKQQKENERRENEFNQRSEELIEKQKQIDKLFDELMSEEMKKLIEQTRQMLNNQNKEQIKKEMEKLQLNNKDVEKELDRMLEQYKQLELEKRLEENINTLDKLAEKQNDLAKQTEKIEADKKLSKTEKQQQLNQLQQEQQKLNEAYKDWQKKMDELRKENQSLETPAEIADTKKEENETKQNQEAASEELKEGKAGKTAEKQKEAASKMQETSDKLQESREKEKENEDEINAEALREILENTIQLSKDQEALMEQMRSISGYSPQYVEAAKTQKSISDNAHIIEDSLQALSKRVPQISSYINREVSKMRENLDRTVSAYSQRNAGEIRYRQQSAMTSANNLGVMLSEILKQMQQEMQANSGKKGGKNKPGKGKGSGGKQPQKSLSDLKKMQEELNKQLREGLNKQEKEGGNKPGGTGLSSQDFAKMAAQQQAIRQQMQKLMNQMGAKEKEGVGGNKAMQDMQRLMEQTEKELYNKQLSSEMIARQQEIMTRMLESEKAEKKREEDNKRQAEQAKDNTVRNPPDFSPYFKQKEKETEWLQTIPPELQPYYKQKAKDYFLNLSAPEGIKK